MSSLRSGPDMAHDKIPLGTPLTVQQVMAAGTGMGRVTPPVTIPQGSSVSTPAAAALATAPLTPTTPAVVFAAVAASLSNHSVPQAIEAATPPAPVVTPKTDPVATLSNPVAVYAAAATGTAPATPNPVQPGIYINTQYGTPILVTQQVSPAAAVPAVAYPVNAASAPAPAIAPTGYTNPAGLTNPGEPTGPTAAMVNGVVANASTPVGPVAAGANSTPETAQSLFNSFLSALGGGDTGGTPGQESIASPGGNTWGTAIEYMGALAGIGILGYTWWRYHNAHH